MSYVFPLWNIAAVPGAGRNDQFPVRHIYCVGRNYAEHAKEMGGDATNEPACFFPKPADAMLPVTSHEVGNVRYPSSTKNYQPELDLVVAIGSIGTSVPTEQALALVYGYAVGLEMTRRDLQNQMRAIKRPWDIGKS